jgi:hypothetical protein
MILSDEQITRKWWNKEMFFTDLRESHLEANAELRKAGERIRELDRIIDAYLDGGLGPVDAMKQVIKLKATKEK